MSVINKMLQDLEKRQQLGVSGDYVPPLKSGFNKLWLMFPLLLAAVLIWQFWPGIPDQALSVSTVEQEQVKAPEPKPMREIQGAQAQAEEIPDLASESQELMETAPVIVVADIQTTEPQEQTTTPPTAPDSSQQAAQRLPKPDSGLIKVQSAKENADTQWQRLKSQAASALAQNDTGKAIDLLQQMLAKAPDNEGVRSKLAELYLGRGQAQQAKQLLQSGLALDPGQHGLRLSLAKIYLLDNNNSEALALLESTNPPLSEYADYYAARAPLARQEGNLELAVADYLLLSRFQPLLAKWRLGLAISLDQAGRQQDALGQYRWLSQQNQVAPQIREFVQQRLRALGG
ncbi:tetratricopeptide repeat protein [Aliiglaciecola sp. CAU 1673]|uniref:tetratricopeptide repeat protein n=1 Tax=Aliiglaciecola sp. CAU 1673 TaxID=3032595 RepID=UPI0023DB20C8|nr:tetratricopeptide repeat protein [Aliiglaciecola sp. CAU 1673]MDF2179139.1 tetratricopeptide repeat protein [Aliiglaciecola sp. CAU 1673]